MTEVDGSGANAEATMTNRERFVATLTYRAAGSLLLPCLFQCFESETPRRWQREGLPRDVHLAEHFGFEQIELAPVNLSMLPAGDVADSEDALEWRIGTDREHADEATAASARVKESYLLADPTRWAEVARRLNPDSPARYPRFWNDYAAHKRDRDYPLGIAFTGPFTWLRELLGMREFTLAFDSQREWILEIVDYLTDFTLRASERAVRDLQPDFIIVRERGAYRVSSVAIPYLMGQALTPSYKRIAEHFAERGVAVRLVEALGNCSTLLHFWVTSGLNGVYFAEAGAGMDAHLLRLKYGNDLAIIGNIDTHRLVTGKREIGEELRSKVPTLCDEGGYIPTPDRPVPAEVPLEHYEYYLDHLRRLFEQG